MIKMKPKVLLPSLKEKKRYIAFEVKAEKRITEKEAKEHLKMAVKDYIGELGLARAGLMFTNDWENSKGIARVSNKETDNVKAAFATLREINGQKAMVRSLRVSGVLAKARKIIQEDD